MHGYLDISTKNERGAELSYSHSSFGVNGHFHLMEKAFMFFDQRGVSKRITVTLACGNSFG